MTQSLVGRRPDVPADSLVSTLVPPPHFMDATFDSYLPDPAHPSQEQALQQCRAVARSLFGRGLGRISWSGKGLYIDGGFGVGKSHLLAALAREGGDRAAYGTFVEYTNLVGALGFQPARQRLQEFTLVCIDEFELDDPGDTVLMSRLMRELTDAGVCVAVTSNTLPDALGQGRFAAQDFMREIQALARIFEVLTIDGEDYRHLDVNAEVAPLGSDQVRAACVGDDAACELWQDLIGDLAHVHPSKLGAYVGEISTLGLLAVETLHDQSQALRFVTLVDRLYDRDVRVVASGTPLNEVFDDAMLKGGFRKKYMRALSRLHAMAT